MTKNPPNLTSPYPAAGAEPLRLRLLGRRGSIAWTQPTGGPPVNAPFDQDGADLLALARGDMSALGALYTRHHAAMLNFLCKRASFALDLAVDVDEVHHQFWEKLPRAARTYDPAKGRGRAWMYGVLHRTLLSYCRREGRFVGWLRRLTTRDRVKVTEWFPPNEEDLDTNPELRAIRKDEWRVYWQSFAALNEADQETILLASEGFTSDECGEIVGCKADAFRQRLRAALRRLRIEIDRRLTNTSGGADG